MTQPYISLHAARELLKAARLALQALSVSSKTRPTSSETKARAVVTRTLRLAIAKATKYEVQK